MTRHNHIRRGPIAGRLHRATNRVTAIPVRRTEVQSQVPDVIGQDDTERDKDDDDEGNDVWATGEF
ncbi:MAG: hypothetical protein ACRDQU_01605 [Pseudonocardiaceae bacterium]